jgi:hypothetical protein
MAALRWLSARLASVDGGRGRKGSALGQPVREGEADEGELVVLGERGLQEGEKKLGSHDVGSSGLERRAMMAWEKVLMKSGEREARKASQRRCMKVSRRVMMWRPGPPGMTLISQVREMES